MKTHGTMAALESLIGMEVRSWAFTADNVRPTIQQINTLIGRLMFAVAPFVAPESVVELDAHQVEPHGARRTGGLR